MVDRIVGSEAHEKALVMGAFQNPELTTRNTWGYGLGFHVPRLGGVYFDRGEVAPELIGAALRQVVVRAWHVSISSRFTSSLLPITVKNSPR